MIIQNTDLAGTLCDVTENISDKVTSLKTEIVSPVKSENEPVSAEVDSKRTFWGFLFYPIPPIRVLFEIARYNVDVRYAPYRRVRAEEKQPKP
ncbi:MAG: hypothetical protein AABX29_03640 [Nanoarchaeota archaeon]